MSVRVAQQRGEWRGGARRVLAVLCVAAACGGMWGGEARAQGASAQDVARAEVSEAVGASLGAAVDAQGGWSREGEQALRWVGERGASWVVRGDELREVSPGVMRLEGEVRVLVPGQSLLAERAEVALHAGQIVLEGVRVQVAGGEWRAARVRCEPRTGELDMEQVAWRRPERGEGQQQ